MKKLLLLFIIIISNTVFAQENSIFNINIVEKSHEDLKADIHLLKDENFYDDILFEDKDYIVKNKCDGEFGGIVYFVNKKNNLITSTKAQCAESVLKKGGKYFLITTLNHLRFSSVIYEIEDPSKLTLIKDFGNEEMHFKKDSIKGTKQIFKSDSILILSSFIFQNEIYYIFSKQDFQQKENEKTFIGKIENDSIVEIQTILDYRLSPFYIETKISNQNIRIKNFHSYSKKIKGFLTIENNEIQFYLSKEK